MRRHRISAGRILLALIAVLAASWAAGQQQAETLAEGPGVDLVRAKCSLCHDLGHITSIRQTREDWADTVKLMIRRGAPVSPADETILVDYFSRYYGR